MSVTDELRKFIEDPLLGYASQGLHIEMLTNIADRIDAEHEIASRALAELIADRDANWVRLPVDASGKTIRLGDDMETLQVGHEGEHSRVEWISLTAGCWEVDGEPPTSMLHYHKPTVEDVLRKFAGKVIDSQILPSVHPTYEEAIAEYAAKLCLAGEDE